MTYYSENVLFLLNLRKVYNAVFHTQKTTLKYYLTSKLIQFAGMCAAVWYRWFFFWDLLLPSYTIIFQTVWHFASASSLKCSHDDHKKTTIGSSISMKLAYQTQTKQYNEQSHLVCVEHDFCS